MRKIIKKNSRLDKACPQCLQHSCCRRGFTLVEALVSISIFSLSILGLLIILSQGISDTGYAKKKVAAEYLAQEGIEYVRNKRDTYVLYDAISPQHGWDTFMTAPAAEINPPPPVDANFVRDIFKTQVNNNQIKITSTVSWDQGSGTHYVTFSEDLFNWIQ